MRAEGFSRRKSVRCVNPLRWRTLRFGRGGSIRITFMSWHARDGHHIGDISWKSYIAHKINDLCERGDRRAMIISCEMNRAMYKKIEDYINRNPKKRPALKSRMRLACKMKAHASQRLALPFMSGSNRRLMLRTGYRMKTRSTLRFPSCGLRDDGSEDAEEVLSDQRSASSTGRTSFFSGSPE